MRERAGGGQLFAIKQTPPPRCDFSLQMAGTPIAIRNELDHQDDFKKGWTLNQGNLSEIQGGRDLPAEGQESLRALISGPATSLAREAVPHHLAGGTYSARY